jgi:hypothetical protein
MEDSVCNTFSCFGWANSNLPLLNEMAQQNNLQTIFVHTFLHVPCFQQSICPKVYLSVDDFRLEVMTYFCFLD